MKLRRSLYARLEIVQDSTASGECPARPGWPQEAADCRGAAAVGGGLPHPGAARCWRGRVVAPAGRHRPHRNHLPSLRRCPTLDGMQEVRDSSLLQLHHSLSGALCSMRARGLDREPPAGANLQVSRPTCQRAPTPAPGGNAGSNPVGATNQHHDTTAADQQEQGSAAVMRVRPSPVRSGCRRASVPNACPHLIGNGVQEPSSVGRTVPLHLPDQFGSACAAACWAVRFGVCSGSGRA